MVITDYLRALLFDWRKNRAIKQAQRSANLYRKKFLVLYRNKVGAKADASHCTSCDKCHPKCPQHIKVSEEFRKINAMVEAIRKGRT